MNIRAIVTDIEGTTSAITFVHNVLFPYAERELPGFVRDRQQDELIAGILDNVRRESGAPDAGTEAVIDTLLRWIHEDRKATSLKALQGHIWKNGYACGDFTGHVYDDAVTNLKLWSDRGFNLYVYSSGSVDAQKLLFGHSDAGDLTPLFRGYFDTETGQKKEPESYARIAVEVDLPASEILFLSDVAEELDAAAEAGMQTVQLIRDDKVVPGTHESAGDFDEITTRFLTPA